MKCVYGVFSNCEWTLSASSLSPLNEAKLYKKPKYFCFTHFNTRFHSLSQRDRPLVATVSGMSKDSDYGAFVEKFVLKPTSDDPKLPLHGLTFAIKEIFDVEGHVSGFGNPEWRRTHSAATSTAPAVLAVLGAGATCIGRTVMDEMAYCINGENKHYGTPTNPCAPDRLPGGSSSGSGVAVAAKLVDFSLGTDTGGSVRVPASYCGILGFRPSHGVVPITGVTPMAQSFDTVGWFARDPEILGKVGDVLLQLPARNPAGLGQLIVAEDCFQLSSIPSSRVSQVLIKSVEKLFGDVVKHVALGDFVKENVPSLNSFMSKEITDQDFNIPSLAALSNALRTLQRHEFKNNHGEWVTSLNPDFGPGLYERVWLAIKTTGANVDACRSVMSELKSALTSLLGDTGVLALPIVPGPPPKPGMDAASSEIFRGKAFSLLSVSGLSGFCQVSIPIGMYQNLPISVSLLAKHGNDGFLLSIVEALHQTLKEQVELAEH